MQTYQTGDSLIFKVPEREISLQPAALSRSVPCDGGGRR
jgi:hypothetical protein